MWEKGKNYTESKRKGISCIHKRSKANWIGRIEYILSKNCLIKHVMEEKIEGRIEVMGRQRKRCKQLLDDLGVKRGNRKSEVEVL